MVGHKMGKCALILRTDWLIEIYVVCLVRGGVMFLRGAAGARWELRASTRGVNWSTELSFDHSCLSIILAGSLTHNRSMCQLIINRNSGNLQLSGRQSSGVGSFQDNLIWVRWSSALAPFSNLTKRLISEMQARLHLCRIDELYY